MQNTSKCQINRQEKAANLSPSSVAKDNPNCLMLICNRQGIIMFASGDSKVLCCRLQELEYKNLFELGFSQESLKRLDEENEYSLQLPRYSSKFNMEIVNREAVSAKTKGQFQLNKNNFMKKVHFSCSILSVKFSQGPIQPRHCKVKQLQINDILQNENANQKLLMLIEVTSRNQSYHIKTKYADYKQTLLRLPSTQYLPRRRARLNRQ